MNLDAVNVDVLIRALTPERYDQLRRAVELGKWHDGRKVSEEERAASLQILIAYDNKYKPAHERIGFIQQQEHEHCGEAGDDHDHQLDHPNVIASTRKR